MTDVERALSRWHIMNNSFSSTSSHSLVAGDAWTLLLGGLAVALGIIGLAIAFALTFVTAIWYGSLLIVLGVLHILHPVFEKQKHRRRITPLLGVAYSAAGIAIILSPAMLTLAVAWLLVVMGLIRVFWAAEFTGSVRVVALFSGLLPLVLGCLAFAGWPSSGLGALEIFIAIDLIVYGAAMLTFVWSSWRQVCGQK